MSLEPKTKLDGCLPSQPVTNSHRRSFLAEKRQSLWIVKVHQALNVSLQVGAEARAQKIARKACPAAARAVSCYTGIPKCHYNMIFQQ